MMYKAHLLRYYCIIHQATLQARFQKDYFHNLSREIVSYECLPMEGQFVAGKKLLKTELNMT